MIVSRRWWSERIWRPVKTNVASIVVGTIAAATAAAAAATAVVVVYPISVGIGTAFFRCLFDWLCLLLFFLVVGRSQYPKAGLRIFLFPLVQRLDLSLGFALGRSLLVLLRLGLRSPKNLHLWPLQDHPRAEFLLQHGGQTVGRRRSATGTSSFATAAASWVSRFLFVGQLAETSSQPIFVDFFPAVVDEILPFAARHIFFLLFCVLQAAILLTHDPRYCRYRIRRTPRGKFLAQCN